MKFYQWVITVTLITAAAFFILLHFYDDIWFVSGITSLIAILSILVFLIFELRKPLSMKLRISIIFGFLILVSWGKWCRDINYQIYSTRQNILMEYGKSNGENRFRLGIQSVLTKTLYLYHKQKEKTETISDIFNKESQELSELEGDIVLDDHWWITRESVTKDEVVIIVRHSYFKGFNEDFINNNGGKGIIQMKAVLTKDGIRYERQN